MKTIAKLIGFVFLLSFSTSTKIYAASSAHLLCSLALDGQMIGSFNKPLKAGIELVFESRIISSNSKLELRPVGSIEEGTKLKNVVGQLNLNFESDLEIPKLHLTLTSTKPTIRSMVVVAYLAKKKNSEVNFELRGDSELFFGRPVKSANVYCRMD